MAFVGSRSPFQDLGLREPVEFLAKAKLAAGIVQIFEDRKVSHIQQAAKLLGVGQSEVSQIYQGRLDDFSIEHLVRSLTALHRDVRIAVEEKRQRRRGRIIVEAE